ncbi:hypothetical protein ACWGJ2_28890 [Streptomyces sp. NPDC054796]
MVLLIVIGILIVAALTGITATVARRQRRGSSRDDVHGDGRAVSDPQADQWKWKARMGGGGGHQGIPPGM